MSGIGFTFRCEIAKSKQAQAALQVASFSWSIFLLTITLNQSALKNSDSYCKKFVFVPAVPCESTPSG